MLADVPEVGASTVSRMEAKLTGVVLLKPFVQLMIDVAPYEHVEMVTAEAPSEPGAGGGATEKNSSFAEWLEGAFFQAITLGG